MTKKAQRQKIYDKYKGRCAYCGVNLTLETKTPYTMQIDHIEPVNRDIETGIMQSPENDVIENKNPACKYCNGDKHSQSLEAWREWLINRFNHLEYLFKSKSKYEIAVNLGVVNIEKWDGLFYFERLE